VFSTAKPERSFLVLAGRGDAGLLTAAALDSMDLHRLRLVVLSACDALRPGDGRSGAFTGFAGALLNAGAGGVVGSLWAVDDRLATPLMAEFHRQYRRTADGAEALREAQLSMLRSSDPARRAPAAWAGFRYVGRRTTLHREKQ
jgi:CHAT domain-containing protein